MTTGLYGTETEIVGITVEKNSPEVGLDPENPDQPSNVDLLDSLSSLMHFE